MTNVLRLPGLQYPSEDYLLAIGEAVFNFGLVEQGAVYFVDHSRPGFAAESYDLTAVPIMKEFVECAQGNPEVTSIADLCVQLAVLRNALLHARPAAEEGSVPILSYAGREGVQAFCIEDIRAFSGYCVTVASFFDKWVIGEAARGHRFDDFEQFERSLKPLVEKWRRRANRA